MPQTSSNLSIFNFDSFQVRVQTEIDGTPWFNANDICNALGLVNSRDSIAKHVDTDDVAKRYTLTAGGRQSQNYVNESGLYALIFGSTKPEAKTFKRWVTSEVLPSIRKQGFYGKARTFAEALRLAADLEEEKERLQLERDRAISTKAEIGHRREATAMNTASQAVKKVNRLEIELDRAKDYASIKRMEMLHHGIKFNWRLLKSAGSDLGIESIDIFDQNYGTVKAYHRDVWLEAYALDINPKSGD